MSAARPTLSLSRKTPLKSKKSTSSSTSGKKKTGVAAAAPKPWVDTVTDLNVYRPSKEELETKKAQRKSQNKVLAKVRLAFLKKSRLHRKNKARCIHYPT